LAILAEIGTVVTAKTTQFTKKIKSARRRLREFANTAKKALGGAALGFTALGVAAFAAVTALTAKAFESLDKIGKSATAIGITTESLIGLQRAAGFAGSSSEEMTKSLQKMQKTIGQAEQGLAGAERALADLGLTSKDLINLSPEEQFFKMSDAMAGIENNTIKTRVAMDIFGRSGANLINLMDGGSESMKGVIKETDDLGLAFNNIDIRQVENSKDSMGKLGEVMTGVGQAILVELAPFIQFVTEKIVEFIKESGGVQEVVAPAFNFVLNVIHNIVNAFQKLRAGIGLAKALFFKFLAGAINGAARLAEVMSSIPLIGDTYREAAEINRAVAESLNNEANTIGLEAANRFEKADNGGFFSVDSVRGIQNKAKADAESSLGLTVGPQTQELERQNDEMLLVMRSINNRIGKVGELA
jgi:hypothetical protein